MEEIARVMNILIQLGATIVVLYIVYLITSTWFQIDIKKR